MSLIEEVKAAQEESFEKWFDRWYGKVNLESRIVQAANEGYTGYTIRIKKFTQYDSELSDQAKYTMRRLRDSRTVTKLKEKLGEGFTVYYVKNNNDYKLLGIPQHRTEEYIDIKWEAV